MSKTINQPTVKSKKSLNVKSLANKAYKIALCGLSEAVLAAFAIIGIMSLIHTEAHVQTGIAVLFVFLLLAVKFNNK